MLDGLLPGSLAVRILLFCSNLGKSGLRVSNIALGTWITFGGQITDEVGKLLSP